MILVDTSVWIEVFRVRRPLDLESVDDFDEVVTCLPAIQEVLQGLRDERAHRRAREAMLALPVVESPLDAAVFLAAVRPLPHGPARRGYRALVRRLPDRRLRDPTRPGSPPPRS